MQLKKLVIKDPKKLGSGFEVQFNPKSLKQSYSNAYQERTPLGAVGSEQLYQSTPPENIRFTLIFQEEIKSGLALFLGSSLKNSVFNRVQDFLELCYEMQGTKHKPRQLRLVWGRIVQEAVLESCDVDYTAFSNKGEPTRAELNVSFRCVEPDPTKAKKKSSPDLTHAQTVKEWQNLPMITEEIYGDPAMYLLVAQANGLDHFRALKPGSKLHFPPTVKDESGEDEE